MNLHTPYPFRQPPDPKWRTMYRAHLDGTLACGSICWWVHDIRSRLAMARALLLELSNGAAGEGGDQRPWCGEDHRTALLKDIARLSADLREAGAAVDLLLVGSLSTPGRTRCRRCHQNVPLRELVCGQGGSQNIESTRRVFSIVGDHMAGSMRCSGAGEATRDHQREADLAIIYPLLVGGGLKQTIEIDLAACEGKYLGLPGTYRVVDGSRS